MGYYLFQTLPSYSNATWITLTSANSDGYHPLWEPILLFELAENLRLLVFATMLVVLFYMKRRVAPRNSSAAACTSPRPASC